MQVITRLDLELTDEDLNQVLARMAGRVKNLRRKVYGVTLHMVHRETAERFYGVKFV